MVIVGVSALIPRLAGAQALRLGVVMDEPRAMLEKLWTDDARQLERAYCITDWSFGVYHISRTPPVQDDTVFRVFAVQEAPTTNATPNSASFECPDGVPELHIHTPSTCMGDDVASCVAGGLNAFSCQPSRGDLEKLIARHDAFAVIQCDRRAFRFYYPTEYGPAPPARLATSSPPPVGNRTEAMKADDAVAPDSGGAGSSSGVAR
jgi:hypothetical protein